MSTCRITLISIVFLLFSLGLVMVFNTGSAHILDHFLSKDVYDPLQKQLFFCFVGIGLGLFVYFLGYEKLFEYSFFWYLFTMILLVLVFIPGLGVEMKGAKRWISFAGCSFQPSELAKYTVPLYFLYLVYHTNKMDLKKFLVILAAILAPLFLIFIEPDNGSCAIMIMTLFFLFILAKIPLSYWTLPLAFVLVIGAICAYHMPHVPGRIRVYLNPESDLKGRGHQPFQAKIAAGSGRLLGKGLGNSMQKLSYLPEARSDYIAAIYAEEFGFIGVVLLVGLYVGLFFCGCVIALKCPDKVGFNIAFLLSFMIAFQAFLNLGVVSSLLPSKGTTLPFFSQGGSSLMMNLVATFLLLNVSKKHA